MPDTTHADSVTALADAMDAGIELGSPEANRLA